MKPGSLIRVLHDDPESEYRIGDIGLIIEPSMQSGLPFHWKDHPLFDVLLNGNMEALFDYEMEVIDDPS
jgi:hypothetical protein